MTNKLKKLFLSENLMRNISILSAVCSIASLVLSFILEQLSPLDFFELIVKTIMVLVALWAFAKFHWDAMKGMIGGLLFALLYQESFLVLGELWAVEADFDAYLIMGVQGSLYLAAQSMSFLITIVIIINHFIINYRLSGNYGNVIFNQLSIAIKMGLCIALIIINVFLSLPLSSQITAGLQYVSDLCIVIMITCIETQLDSFKAIRNDLLAQKKELEGRRHE